MYQDVIFDCLSKKRIRMLDFKKVGSLYLREYHIERSINIESTDKKDIFACFDEETNTIFLNIKRIRNNILNGLREPNNIIEYDLSQKEYLVLFYALHILFHELRHIYQQSFDKEEKDKIKKIAYYCYSISYYIKNKDHDNYTENHELFPIEMDADFHSLCKLYSIFDDIDILSLKNNYALLDYYIIDILSRYDLGTPINNIITESTVFDIINPIYQELLTYLKEAQLDLSERIQLGLPITQDEYQFIDNCYKNADYDQIKSGILIKK